MAGRNSTAHQNDSQLWQEMKNSNHDAYTAIITRYYRPMFAYAIRLNKDADMVKDCIQDVFMQVWKSRKAVAEPGSVKSYLFRSVRFRLYREQKKWYPLAAVKDEYDFDAEISIEVKLIEDQDTADLKRKIESALNKMPPRQKEILYLRFYENLDHDRIAHIMGLNHQVVYNLLHRSLVRLRKDWVAIAAIASFAGQATQN